MESRGDKLLNSPYSMEVVRLLIEGKSPWAIKRFLATKDFPISIEVIFGFRANFFEPLAAIARLELERSLSDRELQESKVLHAKLSRVDSLIELIHKFEIMAHGFETQSKIKTYSQNQSLMQCYDRIKTYRHDLEKARSSEVEKARENAIEEVVQIALDFLKSNPENSKAFIDKVIKRTARSKDLGSGKTE